MALAGVCVGVATILGVDASDVNVVAGAVTSLASVVTYIVMEGKVDVARLGGDNQ
jgi:phage shock protein PspC (stress-responsive transcriptional regulator)